MTNQDHSCTCRPNQPVAADAAMNCGCVNCECKPACDCGPRCDCGQKH